MDSRVQRVLRHMESEEFIRSHSAWLDEVAISLNLSSSRLRHLFTKQTGISLAHLRLVLRLERAKKLLETGFRSVKEIAAQVGMSSQSQFVREFKKAYGLPPKVYRSRLACTGSAAEGKLGVAEKCKK